MLTWGAIMSILLSIIAFLLTSILSLWVYLGRRFERKFDESQKHQEKLTLNFETFKVMVEDNNKRISDILDRQHSIIREQNALIHSIIRRCQANHPDCSLPIAEIKG